MIQKVSIGICTSNDQVSIKTTLEHITRNLYTTKNSIELSEIIIVSSGSTDSTNKIINRFIKKYPDKIKLIMEKIRNGKASALNIILKHYSGDFLVLIPGDVRTERKSIVSLVKYLNKHPNVGVVSGQPLISHSHMKCSSLCRIGSFIWHLHNMNLANLPIEKNSHATGELMALRRGIIDKLPTTIINDDAYIGIIAKDKGWNVGYEPKATVSITIPNRFLDYVSQRKRVVLGHKQIRGIRSNPSTTPKSLLFQTPLYAILLILHSIKRPSDFFYFSITLVVEFYIELLYFLGILNLEKNPHVWKRIHITETP